MCLLNKSLANPKSRLTRCELATCVLRHAGRNGAGLWRGTAWSMYRAPRCVGERSSNKVRCPEE